MPTPIIRKAGAKPNRVVKAKKNTRHSTPHTKNYRFQSFNDRITNLKIDPIRRKRHVDKEEVKEENTHTYFGSSLETWKDTNLSQTFTDFARTASPLSDNLPMVLHNEEQIMDLLVEYIEKGDELAMEPLLALLAHFAHDLDTRFEAHFQRSVSTVAAVAAKHSDFAVIEWSFTCLAWLFKYLSRLLTPDLRPLYDLLAPYLGQKEVKPFIVRFTAEALSFLLRKAAVIYQRDEEPLDRIMEHMLKDCKSTESSNSADLLQQGLMTLLTETIKGVQHGIHFSGVPVMLSLLKHAEANLEESDLVMENLASGVLTSLIHHCMDGSFQAILDVLLAHIHKTINSSPANSNIRFCSTMLFTVISVRKGSRISDWKTVVNAVKGVVAAVGELSDLSSVAAHPTLALLAIALQTSSIDAVLATRQTIESLRSEKWETYFLAFCVMASRLGTERFDNFVLPHFQKFVLEHGGIASRELCTLLPRLSRSKPGMKFKCPSKMVDALLDDIAAVELSLTDLPNNNEHVLARANMALSGLPYLAADKLQHERLEALLIALVHKGLKQGGDIQDFALGPGLQHYLEQHDGVDSSQASNLWESLCNASADLGSLPSFWSNLHRYIKKCSPPDVGGSHLETLETALVASLCSSSHSIRTDVLNILQALYRIKGLPEPEALAAAITIESTPISLDTARSISMNIRRISSEFDKLGGDDLMIRAIPTYCFGLLHVHLSQAWDDATSALASICNSKAGEDVVMALAQAWIDREASAEDEEDVQVPTIVDVNTDGFKVFSDFECPNLAKISVISKQVFEEPSSGLPSPTQQLALDTKRVPLLTSTARSQALKVLHKIPHIAEKRSRILVPVLLKWAAGSRMSEDDSNSDRWARKDQKAMLAVFSQFVNPSVLFRSSEVHAALLALCANGDVEIQQSALKAILAWKESSVVRYKEHLANLLDEARFREELSVFLRGESREDEEEGICAEDQAGLMPVLLRVLYGRAVAGGKEGQAGRRKAIFVALSRFGRETLEQFLDIALSSVVESDMDTTESQIKAPLRQQLGMMYMMNDMLQVLGNELEPSISKLMNGILTCTASAWRRIEKSSTEEDSTDLAMLRSIRQTGIQCLVKVFSTMSDFDTKYYGKKIADNLIVPRLEAFANENAQSISGSLRLISAWTSQPETATLFTGTGGSMLDSAASLLQSPHSKDEVRLFILQHILDNLFHASIEYDVLQPRVSGFVQAIGAVIEQQPSKEILDACVKSFSMLAERITSQNEAVIVTRICTDLLKKPGKAVSPWIKIGLLRTLSPLIERFEVSGAKESLYPALCALFSRLKGSESRTLLADVVSKLVRDDAKLVYVAGICADLNALGKRLDEPDHENRDLAFKRVYQDYATLSLEQWLPIVHNCFYYIRDGEDRVNRTSSSRALELYIDAAAKHESDPTWLVFTEQSVLAGIEFGIKEPSELVRSEYLAVLGHLVEKLPNWQKVQGMQGLLVGGDEEASVFTNFLHIQQHRRLRALRRIKEQASNLGSANVSKIWIPSIEHFVFDADVGDAGRGLADEGVLTIGALASSLSKTAFRGTFTRYAGHLKTRPDFEKIVLRLLAALVDGKKKEEDGSLDTKAILSEQLPPLMEYLHKKDESTVDRRMPVAVTIVKLLKSLPEEEFKARLPAVLTDVSHVLRSKSQEARDQTRKALATIASLVGSQYFGFILKELRGALKRGPQLHVLSYTVHSLLVQGKFETGELDECLPHLMMVVMDDVFGATGAEKDAEEYRSAMKEVKSSKSFDTLELLARTTAVAQLGALVAPIRSLLEEKVDLKTVKKVDELFIRLRKGLDLNPESESRAMLAFCWEIVRAVRLETEAKAVAKSPTKVDERVQRYLIQPEEPKKSKNRDSMASYTFKLVSFSLNLLRKILKRHEDLQTPQNIKGFLPVAGDALVGGQEEVKLAALRFLATTMRIPGLTELDENAMVYLKESFNFLKAAPSLTTDSAKSALELITSVLRERRSVVVKERDLALLLKKLKTDIDEPDRQVIVYKFLRAVLGRKIVMAEVYEVLDAVGEVMVQNPTSSIREAARSAYLQFVLEYPQGKDRWAKQTAFLAANLKFEHASGRMSVMEFLSLMVGKVSEEALSEIAGTIFVHLMPVLCSDVDAKCKAMSGLLIGKIFERVGEKELGKMTALMGKTSWLDEGKKVEVRGGALQCWTILLRSRELPKKQFEVLRKDVQGVLESSVEDGELVQPQLVLHALQTMTALVERAPEVAMSKAAGKLWAALKTLPVTSETTEAIQETVASLLSTFFTDVASSSSKTSQGLAGLPLCGSGRLEISGQDMRQLCSTELQALRAIVFKTSEVLIVQIVRNLVFLGRCFAANGMVWNEKPADEASEEEDEDGEAKVDEKSNNTALEYLFRRLASALQADKFALASRNAALQTISALLHQIDTVPAIQHVLRPLYNLTDTSIPQPPGELYKALADKAQEVMDVIQKKIGAELFVEELGKVRAQAKARRDGRRQKRRIEAVAEPERWAKEKKKKYESKKIKNKAKGEEARGKRRGW